MPVLFSMTWGHVPAAPSLSQTTLASVLDAFAMTWSMLDKPELLRRYLQNSPANCSFSLLAQAGLAYLFFSDDSVPSAVCDTDREAWVPWTGGSMVSKGNLAGTKAKFQSEFLPAMVQVFRRAQDDGIPPLGDGAEDRPKIAFLQEPIFDLNKMAGTPGIVQESAMHFDNDVKFDEDLDFSSARIARRTSRPMPSGSCVQLIPVGAPVRS